jgi:hypothetical protein
LRQGSGSELKPKLTSEVTLVGLHECATLTTNYTEYVTQHHEMSRFVHLRKVRSGKSNDVHVHQLR